MYTAIRKHANTWTKYREFLIGSGGVKEVDAVELEERVMAELTGKLEESRTYVSKKTDWLASNWAGLLPPTVTIPVPEP